MTFSINDDGRMTIIKWSLSKCHLVTWSMNCNPKSKSSLALQWGHHVFWIVCFTVLCSKIVSRSYIFSPGTSEWSASAAMAGWSGRSLSCLSGVAALRFKLPGTFSKGTDSYVVVMLYASVSVAYEKFKKIPRQCHHVLCLRALYYNYSLCDDWQM